MLLEPRRRPIAVLPNIQCSSIVERVYVFFDRVLKWSAVIDSIGGFEGCPYGIKDDVAKAGIRFFPAHGEDITRNSWQDIELDDWSKIYSLRDFRTEAASTTNLRTRMQEVEKFSAVVWALYYL